MTELGPAGADRKRLVILLSIVMALVAGAAVYLVLITGGQEAAPPEAVPAPATQEETQTSGLAVDDGEGVAVITVQRSSRDPFEPITEEQSSSDSTSTSGPRTSGNPPKVSGTKSTTEQQQSAHLAPKGTVQKSVESDPASDSADNDADTKGSEPGVPEPIDKGQSGDDSVMVKLVEVQADSVIARVEGDRTKLYLTIPGPEGVTYVAPLGGGCAWMGRTGSEVRVSICKGKAERM